jgi:hypothetical protein
MVGVSSFVCSTFNSSMNLALASDALHNTPHNTQQTLATQSRHTTEQREREREREPQTEAEAEAEAEEGKR